MEARRHLGEMCIFLHSCYNKQCPRGAYCQPPAIRATSLASLRDLGYAIHLLAILNTGYTVETKCSRGSSSTECPKLIEIQSMIMISSLTRACQCSSSTAHCSMLNSTRSAQNHTTHATTQQIISLKIRLGTDMAPEAPLVASYLFLFRVRVITRFSRGRWRLSNIGRLSRASIALIEVAQ